MYVSCVDDVSYDVLTLSISIGGYLSAAISHTCTYNSGGAYSLGMAGTSCKCSGVRSVK